VSRWFTAAVAARDPRVGEIAVYDDIGFFGITALDFLREVRELGDVSRINLRIDSAGGEVGAALAMFNILRRHPARIHVTVDAVAASAATLIAMAGDQIVMPENAMMLLHNPMAGLLGYFSAEQLRDEAEQTDRWRDMMIATYGAKAPLSPEEIGTILEASTWLTAVEAIEQGFADEVLPVSRAHARVNLASLPGRVPEALRRRAAASGAPPAADGDAMARAVAAQNAQFDRMASLGRVAFTAP